MDPATAARMSDPRKNPNFSRRWRDAPAATPHAAQTTQEMPQEAELARLERLAALLLAEHRRQRNQGAGGGL